MSDSNKKKSSVLGSDMYKFIANMVSKGTDSNVTVDANEKSLTIESESQDNGPQLTAQESTNLSTHFHTDLNIYSSDSCNEETLKISSKYNF